MILGDRGLSPSQNMVPLVRAVIEVGQCISTHVLQVLCLPFSAGTSNLETAAIQATEVIHFSKCCSHSVVFWGEYFGFYVGGVLC